jgi:hypothetical protein
MNEAVICSSDTAGKRRNNAGEAGGSSSFAQTR